MHGRITSRVMMHYQSCMIVSQSVVRSFSNRQAQLYDYMLLFMIDLAIVPLNSLMIAGSRVPRIVVNLADWSSLQNRHQSHDPEIGRSSVTEA